MAQLPMLDIHTSILPTLYIKGYYLNKQKRITSNNTSINREYYAAFIVTEVNFDRKLEL